MPTDCVQKGFGETMPVAPNTKPDGRDNPSGRQLNRRTEFKILGKCVMVSSAKKPISDFISSIVV